MTLGNDFKSARGKIFSKIEAEQIELLEQSITRGDFDLIAIGRALLANPDWVRIVSESRLNELKPFSKKFIEELV